MIATGAESRKRATCSCDQREERVGSIFRCGTSKNRKSCFDKRRLIECRPKVNADAYLTVRWCKPPLLHCFLQRKGTEASNALAVAEQSLATLSAKVRTSASKLNETVALSRCNSFIMTNALLLAQLTEAESALVVKTESLTKASERNKEVTFMLAWLERQYDQMDQGYESVKTEAWKAKEALGRERTVNAQARADLAMLKARRK